MRRSSVIVLALIAVALVCATSFAQADEQQLQQKQHHELPSNTLQPRLMEKKPSPKKGKKKGQEEEEDEIEEHHEEEHHEDVVEEAEDEAEEGREKEQDKEERENQGDKAEPKGGESDAAHEIDEQTHEVEEVIEHNEGHDGDEEPTADDENIRDMEDADAEAAKSKQEGALAQNLDAAQKENQKAQTEQSQKLEDSKNNGRLPEAVLPGEAPPTTLSDSEVDTVARIILKERTKDCEDEECRRKKVIEKAKTDCEKLKGGDDCPFTLKDRPYDKIAKDKKEEGGDDKKKEGGDDKKEEGGDDKKEEGGDAKKKDEKEVDKEEKKEVDGAMKDAGKATA